MKVTGYLVPVEVRVEAEPNNASAVIENTFDPVAFDAGMQKWRGFLREQLLADGYATTEELMDDIRGR